MVDDLPIWLAHAKSLGMRTMFCTSGRRLKERSDEIAPLTDRLIISLEAIGVRQDEIRRTKGLFKKIVAGLMRFKERSSSEIIIWSHINRENQDEVERIAQFAQDLRIKVEFFPTTTYCGYNEAIILDDSARSEIFNTIKKLKRSGYPINNTWYALELMRSHRKFQCNIPRLSIQVYPDGMVYPCESRMIPDIRPYGHINGIDLKRLTSSMVFREESQRLKECNSCLLPCVAHLSDFLLMQGVRKITGVP